MEYCSLCGGKYVQGRKQPWLCSKCGNEHFLNSSPTVEIALFDSKGRIILAKRGIEPNKGKYDLPGGFLNLGEKVENGLLREIEEELGLTASDFTSPVYCTSWNGDGYRFSKEDIYTLNLVFTAKIHNPEKLKALDDVESTMFCEIADLGKIEFSYPGYPEQIKMAFNKLFN